MQFIVVRLKSFIFFLCVVLGFVACFATIFNVPQAAAVIVKPARLQPLYRVDGAENKVALTFDASWENDKTDEILQLLQEYNQKATFFAVGFWSQKNAAKLQAVASAGMEIGTRSNTLPFLTSLSASQIELELSTSVEVLKQVSGQQNVEFFRCPHGEFNDRVIKCAQGLGLKTVQWSIDSGDRLEIGAKKVAERVLNGIKGGDIVLLHNDSKDIVNALRLILEGLRVRSLYSVTMHELVGA